MTPVQPNATFAISTAAKRNSRHWAASEVTWAEICDWVQTIGNAKESGNYLLGTLRRTVAFHKSRDGQEYRCEKLHRRKDAVVSRSAITLDVDSPEPDFLDRVSLLFPHAALIHTTFSSTPPEPRYRMIIPTDREMAPDEYVHAATVVMNQLGVDSFDPGSSQPERYMFLPAAKHAEWFEYQILEGPPASVDRLLEGFTADLATLPMPEPSRFKRNPFELEGVVGAFNRAYDDMDLLIHNYELPYEAAGEDRWQLIGSAAVAGMGWVADGIVYSHHSSDPAFDQACTAFDLVRLHRFGELDEGAKEQTPLNKLPSYNAMLDLASTDARVTAELVGVDFDTDVGTLDDDGDGTAPPTPQDWKLRLNLAARTGVVKDTVQNWDLIAKHDELFSKLYYNELTMSIEVDSDLPWRPATQGGPVFGAADRIALGHYMEREYKFRPNSAYLNGMVDVTAMKRYENPVRDYLKDLVWDGTERLETCLPGVEDTPYARLVARKSMVAAVARMFEPGCKWDHTLVLYGSEGLGKSWWIDRISRGHSASLGRIGDKDTLLIMQRTWIMVSDEGHTLRKADADATKEFLTRREDVFRLPYERESKPHPRHCVIWGTTNDEVFLRRQEGNRRFLIVHCKDAVDFEAVTDEYVSQLWAEAVYLYRNGEQLYLTDEQSQMAKINRESFIEEDALAGVISEFLDTPVPAHYEEGMTPEQRQMWQVDRAAGLVSDGSVTLNQVCSAQIWVEALGRRFGEHRRTDLLEITKSLRDIGWKALPTKQRIPGYGPQQVFFRPGTLEAELL